MIDRIDLEARAMLKRELAALGSLGDAHSAVEYALPEHDRTAYLTAHELLALAHSKLERLAKRYPIYAREREKADALIREFEEPDVLIPELEEEASYH